MVNKVIYDYLKLNKGKFSLDVLRKKILSRGYSEQAFDEALASLVGFAPIKKEISSIPIYKPDGVSSISFHKPKEINPTHINKPKVVSSSSKNNLFRIIGILGFVFIALWMVFIILDILKISLEMNSFLSQGITLSLLILIGFYFYGFFKLGKQVSSNLLKVASILSIFVIVILLIFSIWSFVMGILFPNNNLFEGNPFFINYVVLGFLFFVLGVRYVFTISLIKIKKIAKFSIVAGIVGLMVTIIITLIIGYFTYLIVDGGAWERFSMSLVVEPMRLVIFQWIFRGLTFVFLIGVFFESLMLLKVSKNVAKL